MELKRLLRVIYLRKMRDKEYVSRALLVVGFVVLVTLLIPRSSQVRYYHVLGENWMREQVVAPFDFSIYKSKDSLQNEMRLVREAVLPVMSMDSAAVESGIFAVQKALEELSENLEMLRATESRADTTRQQALREKYFLQQLSINPDPFISQSNAWIKASRQQVPFLIRRIYQKGYADGVPEQTAYVAVATGIATQVEVPVASLIVGRDQLRTWLQTEMPDMAPRERELLSLIIIRQLKPNLHFDATITEQMRTQRSNWVSPVLEEVEQGEVLIKKGEKVTPYHGERLIALSKELQVRGGEEQPTGIVVGRLLLVMLLTSLLLTFLKINRPGIFFSNSKLALLLTILLLAVGAMVVCTKINEIAIRLLGQNGPNVNLGYIYLAPACIVPIFINNFFDHRVAFFANLLVALFGAVLVQHGLEYAFVQLIAGTVAVYSLRRLRKREVFFYTLVFIFLGYTTAYLIFNLYHHGVLDQLNLNTLLLFGINVLFTIIAYNLIYLFEQVFRVTSDLTYLELLDTNHPLLKDLAKKAPGTFQHSLQVANISEAIVNEIGGNALLAHVGALYHDIGKMASPRYFIENHKEESVHENPHDRMLSKESAEIIIGHVAKGVAMAERYHLPTELVQFIETHHGTTRVEFFYRKYLRENGESNNKEDNQFRYPGPLPFNKETAVLMLADSVEAASRSLKNPTSDSLDSLVDKIIDHKIADNQLVNSPLTFQDISKIREVLKSQLNTIYHGRIEYPKPAEEVAPLSGLKIGK